MQNLLFILNSVQGGNVMGREIGLDKTNMHRNQNVIQTLIASQIHDQVHTYEPRAEVIDVSFGENHETGEMTIELEVNVP